MNEMILEKYRSTPTNPGVYLMKNSKGRVIYVGKALNLKKRLGSYFARETGHDIKTGVLVKHITDFHVIITSTEHEALILESTLIKKHKPRYNVILKDGKRYPCLRIDTAQDYPCLEVVRKIKNDNALYFGPYSSAYSVKSTLRTVNRIFRLRKCRKNQFKNRSRPCLNFQIKSCLGVCCNEVPKDEYHKVVKDVVLFLKGRAPELIRRLKNEMTAEAALEQFEKAAQIRDTVFAIEKTLEKQVAVTTDMKDRDVIACVGGRGKAVVTILFVKSGNLVGTRHYHFDMSYSDIPEILDAFLKQYYEKHSFIPAQILLSGTIEDKGVLEQELSMKKGKKVSILVPERGEKKRIVEMALLNGKKELEQTLSEEAEARANLLMLQKLLGMKNYPGRIECFDNSNLSGTDPVSSMVVFTRGVPDKSQYRKFIISECVEYDDYAAMTEVLTRRFKKQEADMPYPDLLVVDGGKGQLSMAVNVLLELGIETKFQVAGLAKKESEKGEQEDKIYLPGRSNPVNTAQSLKALFLLQRLRDEAHRFAVTFQRKRRSKRAGASIVDNVHGIGKKRKEILLKKYRGISRMKTAAVSELASLPGMTQKAAEELSAALKRL